MAFLKTILIILLVFYALKIIFRFTAPYMMRFLATKAQRHFEKKFGSDFSQFSKQTEEGTVTIEKKQATSRKSTKDVGEYVDYEEID